MVTGWCINQPIGGDIRALWAFQVVCVAGIASFCFILEDNCRVLFEFFFFLFLFGRGQSHLQLQQADVTSWLLAQESVSHSQSPPLFEWNLQEAAEEWNPAGGENEVREWHEVRGITRWMDGWVVDWMNGLMMDESGPLRRRSSSSLPSVLWNSGCICVE